MHLFKVNRIILHKSGLINHYCVKVEQQQKQAQKSVYSPSPVFHYPPEYGNVHDYSAPPLYHHTSNHVPTGVLTPPSDFAPQSLGTSASLEGMGLILY